MLTPARCHAKSDQPGSPNTAPNTASLSAANHMAMSWHDTTHRGVLKGAQTTMLSALMHPIGATASDTPDLPACSHSADTQSAHQRAKGAAAALGSAFPHSPLLLHHAASAAAAAAASQAWVVVHSGSALQHLKLAACRCCSVTLLQLPLQLQLLPHIAAASYCCCCCCCLTLPPPLLLHQW